MPDQVASGYKDLLDTPLGTGVIYAGRIIDKNWDRDFIQYVCNTERLSPPTKCGQTMVFNKPPRVGPWRPYEVDQLLVQDQPTNDSFCVSICGAAYKSIKFDTLAIHRACNDWDAFEVAFLEDAWKNLSDLWRQDILTGMRLHTSKRNVGKNAGRNQNIDLGSLGNPVDLTPDNIVNFYARLQATLGDAGRWYDNEMFVIVPRAMTTLLLQSMFDKQVCCDVGNSVLFKGLKASDILGFTVIETDSLRPIVNKSTKKLEYPIIAGWNEAYAFTGDIINAEVNKLPRTFGVTYDMLTIYGGGIIYPEALANAYVTFSTEGLTNKV